MENVLFRATYFLSLKNVHLPYSQLAHNPLIYDRCFFCLFISSIIEYNLRLWAPKKPGSDVKHESQAFSFRLILFIVLILENYFVINSNCWCSFWWKAHSWCCTETFLVSYFCSCFIPHIKYGDRGAEKDEKRNQMKTHQSEFWKKITQIQICLWI